jgi:hypothetical protein
MGTIKMVGKTSTVFVHITVKMEMVVSIRTTTYYMCFWIFLKKFNRYLQGYMLFNCFLTN